LRQSGVDDWFRAAPQRRTRAPRRRQLRGGSPFRPSSGARRPRGDRGREPQRAGSVARMSADTIRLGLRENAAQFSLLVGLNAFVGASVGLERSVLPLAGEHDFGLASKTAVLSFIVAFGAAKALANLASGPLADREGRKRVLVAGWALALPVPLLIG